MDMMLKIALCIVLIGIVVLYLQTAICAQKAHKESMERLRAANQDLLDRLMARNLAEVKAVQRKDSACLRVVSKRKNEVRAAEQAKRWGEQQ